MDFWKRLRSELNYQDITHKELADKINIQKATLEAKFLREIPLMLNSCINVAKH